MSDWDKEFGDKIISRIVVCLDRVSYLRDRIEFEHKGGLAPDPSRSIEISKAAEELFNVCQCWEVFARTHGKEGNEFLEECGKILEGDNDA